VYARGDERVLSYKTSTKGAGKGGHQSGTELKLSNKPANKLAYQNKLPGTFNQIEPKTKKNRSRNCGRTKLTKGRGEERKSSGKKEK